jgi:ABC-type glutathione transport system ATPase component
VPDIPPVGATIAFMLFESIVFMGTAFYIDMQSIVPVTPVATVETVTNLDPDVEAERVRTEATAVSVPVPAPEATAVSVSVHVPVEAVVTDLHPKAAASESIHRVKPPFNNNPTMTMLPLKVSQLRKVFPPKQAGRAAVIANENVSFCVEKGEIFGLLGANGEMSVIRIWTSCSQ